MVVGANLSGLIDCDHSKQSVLVGNGCHSLRRNVCYFSLFIAQFIVTVLVYSMCDFFFLTVISCCLFPFVFNHFSHLVAFKCAT